jgi:hypothetical protein
MLDASVARTYDEATERSIAMAHDPQGIGSPRPADRAR